MTPTGTMDVAKKKTGPPKPDRPRSDWERKPLVVQIRGSLEWKAWVERVAEFDRHSVAEFADRAMAEYAQRIGFAERPPRR
jgi:hypothetical protein